MIIRLPLLLLLLLLAQPIHGQFGEIASLVTGLLGSGGGGAGLGSLAGTAGSAGGTAAGLAGAGATAGQGASSALGGVGALYQLAQAALQLTGTGVGIANQASESAWFPVAVEHAARMNRDFQDRLLSRGGGVGGRGGGGAAGGGGGGLLPTLPSLVGISSGGGGGGRGGGSPGKEYGKNFGSGEAAPDYETEGPATIQTSTAPPTGVIPSGNGPSPTAGGGWGTQQPYHQRRVVLPGLVSLLPGESPSRGESNTDGGEEESHVDAGPIVPLAPLPSSFIATEPPPIVRIISKRPPTNEDVLWRSTTTPTTTTPRPGAESIIGEGPQIDYEEEQLPTNGGEKKKEPMVEFSIDSHSSEAGSDEELTATVKTPSNVGGGGGRVGPPRATRPINAPITATPTDEHKSAVPKLGILIDSLKNGGLRSDEFAEIHHQIRGNGHPHEPIESSSTRPPPQPAHTDFLGGGARPSSLAERKGPIIVNEKRERAVGRNLFAFRRAIGAEEAVEAEAGEGQGLASQQIRTAAKDRVLANLAPRPDLGLSLSDVPKTQPVVISLPQRREPRARVYAIRRAQVNVDSSGDVVEVGPIPRIPSSKRSTTTTSKRVLVANSVEGGSDPRRPTSFRRMVLGSLVNRAGGGRALPPLLPSGTERIRQSPAPPPAPPPISPPQQQQQQWNHFYDHPLPQQPHHPQFQLPQHGVYQKHHSYSQQPYVNQQPNQGFLPHHQQYQQHPHHQQQRILPARMLPDPPATTPPALVTIKRKWHCDHLLNSVAPPLGRRRSPIDIDAATGAPTDILRGRKGSRWREIEER